MRKLSWEEPPHMVLKLVDIRVFMEELIRTRRESVLLGTRVAGNHDDWRLKATVAQFPD